jgi:thymidine phosphorylase
LTDVARHGARIQIAALTAAGSAIAGWARATDRLVEAVGVELLRRLDGETDSGELVVQLASATNAHLRELAALPSATADHFDMRLSRVSIDN